MLHLNPIRGKGISAWISAWMRVAGAHVGAWKVRGELQPVARAAIGVVWTLTTNAPHAMLREPPGQRQARGPKPPDFDTSRHRQDLSFLVQESQCLMVLCVKTATSIAHPKLRNVPIIMYSATLRWVVSLISPKRRIDFAAMRKPILVG